MTTRAGDDNLNGNGSDRTAHGSVATSDAPADDTTIDGAIGTAINGADEDHDATAADGVPALPADSIGSLWRRRADPDPPDTEAEDDGSPVFSFGPPEAVSVPVSPAPADWVASESASNDWLASEPAEPSAEPDPPGSLWSPSPSPVSDSSGSSSSGSSSSTAEPPAVSPAAFAWEMPDPPPDSPSSPARTFLRTGTSAKPAAEKPPAAAPRPPAAAGGQKKPAVSVRPPNQKAPQAAQKKASSKRSARQAHLTIARVEPSSVMKVSFIVSLVAFVILFVAVSVLYGVLAGLGVFDSLQRVVTNLTSSQSSTGVNAETWFSASRVLGYTALLGSFNVVIITAMSTIGAVVYNLTSRLVGGVEVTLRESE